jgi:hypothetical protein
MACRFSVGGDESRGLMDFLSQAGKQATKRADVETSAGGYRPL